jgi:branched-chain amino acid transport system substrate-binding protein
MPVRFPLALAGRRWALAALLVLTAAGVAALERDRAVRASNAPVTLRIGALLDLKRGWTTLGRASRVTLRLAAADANAQLARSGSATRVKLRIVDVAGDPAKAARALRRLAAEGTRVVIGPQASAEVEAVRPVANARGVVVLSQGSTAHALALRGDNVLRLVADDRREAEALVALLKRDGVRAVVPMWRADAGNAGLATSVRRAFRADGGTVAPGVPYATDEADFAGRIAALRDQVAALQAAGAGRVAVYLAAFDEVVDVFHAAAGDPAVGAVDWYGSDGVALSRRLATDGPAAMFASRHRYPNPTLGLDAVGIRRSAALRKRVRARLGSTPDAFALSAYDGLRIAVRAAARAGGTTDVRRFRRALVQLADGYVGVTGPIRLNRAGDRAFDNYDFWSLCAARRGFRWRRTFAYVARGVGRGSIVERQACRAG